MGRTLRLALGGLAWSALAYGALALRLVPGDYSHALCGPWGCLPPLQALAAMHAFWLVALAPPVLWAGRAWTPRRRRAAGRAAVALALLGLVAVVVHDAWARGGSVGSHGMVVPLWRAAFALATQVDIPLAPLLAAGIYWWARGTREPVAPGGKSPGRHPEDRPEGAGQVDQRHA